MIAKPIPCFALGHLGHVGQRSENPRQHWLSGWPDARAGAGFGWATLGQCVAMIHYENAKARADALACM